MAGIIKELKTLWQKNMRSLEEQDLGKAPAFAASFKLLYRFFSCFSTLFFFSSCLLAKGSWPGSEKKTGRWHSEQWQNANADMFFPSWTKYKFLSTSYHHEDLIDIREYNHNHYPLRTEILNFDVKTYIYFRILWPFESYHSKSLQLRAWDIRKLNIAGVEN